MRVQLTRPETRIIPLSKWNEFHVWPTTASLRRLLRKEDGPHKAVIRIGKRLLIDEKKFFEWMKESNVHRSE